MTDYNRFDVNAMEALWVEIAIVKNFIVLIITFLDPWKLCIPSIYCANSEMQLWQVLLW